MFATLRTSSNPSPSSAPAPLSGVCETAGASRAKTGLRSGFALVITVSILVLLSVIAVGLLTLSTVTVRTAGASAAQAEARSNARLALILALGRLQKLAGPDQRVTASADLTGTTSDSHWTGVWQTTTPGSGNQAPVIAWNNSEGSLVDARADEKLSPDDLRLGWLVSTGGLDRNPGSSLENSVTLVDRGSVGDEADRKVRAPVVPISGNGKQAGSYAYWIGDQSLKANLDLLDPYAPAEPDAGDDGTSDGFRRYLLPQQNGIASLPGLESYDAVSLEDLSKVSSLRQAELTSMAANPESFRRYFHDLGVGSRTVLSDSLRGGLKRDLTVFLENGAVDAMGPLLPAVDGSTPLLSDHRRMNHGPRLGVLKSWHDLREEFGSGDSLAPRAAEAMGRMDKFRTAPQLDELDSQPLHPVIACAELYTRMAYYRGYLTVHLFPRIVLWNPWNVRLEAEAYSLDFNHCLNDSVTVEKEDRGGLKEIVNAAYNTRGNKNQRLWMVLEPTAFEPGEALVFSPKPAANAIAGRAMPFQSRTGSGGNRMSAEVDPRLLTNFYISLGALSGVTARDLPAYANHNKGSYYWVDMMDWWEGNPDNGLKISLHLGEARRHSDLLKKPLLQLLDTDNWRRGYEGRYNNGRWKVGGREPIYDYERTADFLPWARTNYGFRLRWWQETPNNLSGDGSRRYWDAAVASEFNLRAAFCHRSPYDNVTDNGESHHWYMWGPYALEREQGLPYDSSELAAHPGSNGYRGNVFFTGSKSRPDHRYPLYDVPVPREPLVSLGAFQHAQLSSQVWHPSYAIGSSFVPPNLKRRDRSADRDRTLERAWGDQLPHLPKWLRQNARREAHLYDLAYIANHETWDRYFLSGAGDSERLAFAEDPTGQPLPNNRLVPAGSASLDDALLANFYQAASQLLLAGAFNVNSTSIDAWKAFLSSQRDLVVPTGDGGDGSEGTPFPRLRQPPGAAAAPTSPYSVETWTGFRRLTDEQIESLATAIVDQVRTRGPFLSVSDFVNRRLISDRESSGDLGLMGPLQAAIEHAGGTGLNNTFHRGDLVRDDSSMGEHNYAPGEGFDKRDGGTWAHPEHARESKGTGIPSYLQQGDLLQSLGGLMTARGDTFLIRAYGRSAGPDGSTILAEAWCEALVQRNPGYVDSRDPAWEPASAEDGKPNTALSEASQTYGRRFSLVSFRWLAASEK